MMRGLATGNGDDGAAEVVSRCSSYGSMPLYLISVGYLIKTLIVLGIEKWLHEREEEHQTSSGSNTEPAEGNSMNSRALLADDQDPDDDKGVQHRSIWTSFCRSCRCSLPVLDSRCRESLKMCWTAFKIITPSVQFVIDSIQVYNSETSHGWPRYQCYVEVFANSPNLGSVFVFYATVLDDAMNKKETSVWWLAFGLLALGPYSGCSLFTHILPFCVVYCWVLLLLLVGMAVATVVLATLFPSDNPESNASTQITSRMVGLLWVLLFALGASTMIRFYSGDYSYIDSLWLAMSERKTHDFLYHAVESAAQARNRWYSFVHFFY